MLEEMHELLGGTGALAVSAVVMLGAAIYQYPRLRHLLPVPRARLAKLHGWGAVLFLAMALAHYLLAPRVHPLQLLGALGLAAVFVLGQVLRRDKRAYRVLVQSKAVLTLVAAVALVAGHLLVGDGQDHRAERSSWYRAASGYQQAAGSRRPLPGGDQRG